MSMPAIALVLATLGAVLLIAVAAHFISKKVRIPQVTLLIVAGLLIGPSGFNVLPPGTQDWYPLISSMALLMVGFLLGGKLSLGMLRRSGREIMWFSLFEVLGATILIGCGLLAIGVDPPLALVLAGIGPASAPAATVAVVQEARAEGPFTDALLGVVAIDDAWGLIAFSVLLAVAGGLVGDGGPLTVLAQGGLELAGALALGLVLGLPTAFLTRHLRAGEPLEAEALGIVLICGGLALWLNVSFLLSVMVVGAVIVNLARENEEPFRLIENIEWPFLVLFFVLSGASLRVEDLTLIGGIGVAYVAFRAFGLVAGAWLGGAIGRADPLHRRWMGLALMPQAGVALGMALIAGSHFPELKPVILPVVVGSTVVFELAGPLLTRLALARVGEIGRHRPTRS